MKTTLYLKNDTFIAGITKKDISALEQNNMGLHVAKNFSHVISNRKKLAAFLDTDITQFVFANQTHSNNFQEITETEKGRGAVSLETAIPNMDALYTFEPNLVLCCLTADCVPVIFYHEQSGVIGVIHSGWQGTVNEITKHVFQHLIRKRNCHPENFIVYIGPALSQKKFEVDADVYEKFHTLGYADEFMYYQAETNKYHIDNQQTVRKQCELTGIPKTRIKIDTTCTFKSSDGFSYREDKQAGRHVSFIVRKK